MILNLNFTVVLADAIFENPPKFSIYMCPSLVIKMFMCDQYYEIIIYYHSPSDCRVIKGQR